jgi:hypothetical protein
MALNIEAFHAAQRRTEEAAQRGDMANAQISPWEWAKLGGDPSQYAQLYGPNAFYNPNGSVTNLGSQHNLQPAQDVEDPRNKVPGTGIPIQPGTGTWMDPNGVPIQPGMQDETTGELADTAGQWARWNAQFEGQMNRVNEQTPFGSSQYVQDPETGQWIRKTDLSAWQQRLLEQQQGRDFYTGQIAQGKQNEIANQGAFSYGDIPEISGAQDMLGERRRVEDSVYQNMLNRMQPAMDKELQDFQQQMADQGVAPGTAKYNEQYRLLKQSQNDALQNAQAEATAQGRQEFTTNYDVQSAQRKLATGEYGEQRYAPYNEQQLLLNSQRDLVLPQFQSISNINTQKVDPSQISQTWRTQDIGKYLGELDAETRKEVARIQAEASMYGADADNEGEGEPSDDYSLDDEDNGPRYSGGNTEYTEDKYNPYGRTLRPKSSKANSGYGGVNSGYGG